MCVVLLLVAARIFLNLHDKKCIESAIHNSENVKIIEWIELTIFSLFQLSNFFGLGKY